MSVSTVNISNYYRVMYVLANSSTIIRDETIMSVLEALFVAERSGEIKSITIYISPKEPPEK